MKKNNKEKINLIIKNEKILENNIKDLDKISNLSKIEKEKEKKIELYKLMIIVKIK